MVLKEVEARIRAVCDILHTYAEPRALRVVLTGVEDIRRLCDHIPRKKAISRAPRASRRMTKQVESWIWELREQFPDATQQAIATMVGVTAGRVSEVLAGKRT